MISKRRVSRWIAYFGVFAFIGTLMQGQLFSALFALVVLVGQYAALEMYSGYAESGPPDATPEP